MTKTFDDKIEGLKDIKLKLNVSFLQLKKKEYEKKISELLANPIYEWEEDIAIAKFNEVREFHTAIWEINYYINNITEVTEKIDKKISFFQEKKEKIKYLPLYKDTEEWIAEILWSDPVYQYAKELGKEKLIKKLEERSLTENEYTVHLENMYKELFKKTFQRQKTKPEIEIPAKIEIKLPEWMSEQINEELKDNKKIKSQDIEKFLKNELKKNAGEIMITHIKNKFKDNYNQAYEYIRKLIINYPWFQIIENKWNNTPVAQTKSKRDKLISSISTEDSEEHKNERLKIENLLIKLNDIWKIGNLRSRISWYLDLFEELKQNFEDRKDFEPKLYEIITKYPNIEIEKEIIKTLNSLIQGKPCIERTWLYKYNVYKFNRASWRMLAYPNGEIFTICQHEKYEEIINTQPPTDKSK